MGLRRAILGGLTGLGLAIGAPAQATPDRGTSSQDQILAATQQSLFVMRTIEDNLGSYYSALVDQYLVEIDLDTGAARAVYPLRRMSVDELYADEDRIPGKVTERAVEGADMMAVLRAAGAAPMRPRAGVQDAVRLEDGQLFDGETLVMSNYAIRAAARAQLAILRETYPPLSEEAYFSKDSLDFYDLYAEGDWECTLSDEALLLRREAGVLRVLGLMCELPDYVTHVSFHVFLSDTK